MKESKDRFEHGVQFLWDREKHYWHIVPSSKIREVHVIPSIKEGGSWQITVPSTGAFQELTHRNLGSSVEKRAFEIAAGLAHVF